MTFSAWKKEFLPTTQFANMTPLEAVDHAVKKWQGLLQGNLGAYGMTLNYRTLREAGGGSADFHLDADSCALCHFYFHDSEDDDPEEDSKGDCPSCPIVRAGGLPCGEDKSSWELATTDCVNQTGVKAMIRDLRAARDIVREDMEYERRKKLKKTK
jgi:hypothetical protein